MLLLAAELGGLDQHGQQVLRALRLQAGRYFAALLCLENGPPKTSWLTRTITDPKEELNGEISRNKTGNEELQRHKTWFLVPIFAL